MTERRAEWRGLVKNRPPCSIRDDHMKSVACRILRDERNARERDTLCFFIITSFFITETVKNVFVVQKVLFPELGH